MTEAEWLAEAWRPQWMADHLRKLGTLRTKPGRRKLRLFACACCRVAWDILPDDRLRTAVLAAERFADGQADKVDLNAHRLTTLEMRADFGPYGSQPVDVRVAIDMAVATTEPQPYAAAFAAVATYTSFGGAVAHSLAGGYASDLFRCLFGNPLRPADFEAEWRSPTAVALARGILTDRAFDRMPILADALEESGCEDPAILDHCRRPGPRAYGCWVIDAVLGIK